MRTSNENKSPALKKKGRRGVGGGGKRVGKAWDKDQSEKGSEKGVSLFEEDVLMSSDEDVPAPSPSAAVLVRHTREA